MLTHICVKEQYGVYPIRVLSRILGGGLADITSALSVERCFLLDPSIPLQILYKT
jgi:hypothetical protein